MPRPRSGIEITSVTANPGPVVTQYELTPAPNVRISRIEGLGDEVRLRVREHSGVELRWEIRRVGVP